MTSGFYRSAGKRLFDLFFAVAMLIMLFPLMCALACAVRICLGCPVLFRQCRAGIQGKMFSLHKYRSMTACTNSRGHLLPDSERLTLFGRLIRTTSLDELPQLIDVLRGHMSLVGPRPLPVRYLPRYSPEQMRRHEVRPGITGWAQVNGRNGLTWEQKFALDVWYVDHMSFWLDLRIMALTLWKLIIREGITQPGQATMEEFMGQLNNANPLAERS